MCQNGVQLLESLIYSNVFHICVRVICLWFGLRMVGRSWSMLWIWMCSAVNEGQWLTDRYCSRQYGVVVSMRAIIPVSECARVCRSRHCGKRREDVLLVQESRSSGSYQQAWGSHYQAKSNGSQHAPGTLLGKCTAASTDLLSPVPAQCAPGAIQQKTTDWRIKRSREVGYRQRAY